MLVMSLFILTYLVYNNYVILNEDEFIIIVANLVWITLASSAISSSIYKILDHKGNSIKDIFLWYLMKKRDLYSNLIKYYKGQQEFSQDIKDLTYICYVNVITMVMYICKRDSEVILKYQISSNLLSQGLTLKSWLVSEKLMGLLNVFTDVNKIKDLYNKQFN